MKNIIIKGNKVVVEREIGNVRGEFYYKNNKMYLQADTSYALTILRKFKQEIEQAINN